MSDPPRASLVSHLPTVDALDLATSEVCLRRLCAAGGARVSTVDSLRLARAIWLTAKPIDVNTWRVRGGTADHMVEVVDGRCYCDCVDAQVRGPGCKHCLLVRLLGGDPAVVLALRALVPPPEGRSTERVRVSNWTHSPESPNSGATAPDSRQAPAHVGAGATFSGGRGDLAR